MGYHTKAYSEHFVTSDRATEKEVSQKVDVYVKMLLPSAEICEIEGVMYSLFSSKSNSILVLDSVKMYDMQSTSPENLLLSSVICCWFVRRPLKSQLWPWLKSFIHDGIYFLFSIFILSNKKERNGKI